MAEQAPRADAWQRILTGSCKEGFRYVQNRYTIQE